MKKSRHCTLAKFIAGLGIPMVGRHAGRDLDRYFGGSWEAFESAIQGCFDFTQLPNFGKTMHNNIYKWYADEEEAKLWRPLLDKIIFEKETTNMSTNTTNPFYGKTVVATGKLENYTRDGISATSGAGREARFVRQQKHGLPDRGRKGRQQACKGAAARCEDSDRTGI